MFENLYPSLLWHYFLEIAKIPRPSNHEEKIVEYLMNFAKSQGLDVKKDQAGNVLITKNASHGRQNQKKIILQSHVDMVCEKNSNSGHDFLNDPIQPYIDGDWVKARGTTLGADDGIGVAAMLAVLADPTVEHAPLECLFTVDEESGLTGAFELTDNFLDGKVLLNLDSEDEGELFIGCAGGIDTCAIFKTETSLTDNGYCSFRVSVTGLKGGHSGDEIHTSLANAIKITNQFLLGATDRFAVALNLFEGGNLKNAIPREAFATISLPVAMKDEFILYCDTFRAQLRNQFDNEPNIQFSIQETAPPEFKMTPGLQRRLLNALHDCPHGVIAWSKTIDGLVETSTNLASIKLTDAGQITITTSQRSSIDHERIALAQKIATLFQKAGAITKLSKGYPGWEPNLGSPVLELTRRAYEDLFHAKPLVKAIHAGLECGLFLEKYPNLDMISFGPTIKGAHSPDERLHIFSVEKFWKLLLEVLKRIG